MGAAAFRRAEQGDTVSATWPICPDDQVTTLRWLGHDVRVHRLAVPALQVVELRALRSEYGTRFAMGEIGPTPTGAYNCRNRRPYPETPVTPERHSEHAHAVAIDVDWDDNPLSTEGILRTNFDRFGYEDGCDWLAAWLEPPDGLPVFFRWGGGWTTDLAQACLNLRHNGERIRTGVVDGMHFELSLTPTEVRAYDWDAAIAKEEQMNKELKQATEFVRIVRAKLKPGPDDATVKGAAERVAAATLKVEGQSR